MKVLLSWLQEFAPDIDGDPVELGETLSALGLAVEEMTITGQGLDGIVLPGGESTTMLKMLAFQGLWDPLGDLLRSGRPVFATCAGLILCADDVQSPAQQSYGVLDVSVTRNAWGRQIRSGTFELRTHGAAGLPDATPRPSASRSSSARRRSASTS